MIKEYTISNFKAFSTPATLPIKPITLIYGANSAGKSSIFQSLLMLKQTLEEAENDQQALITKGSLVDVGGYRDFVHNHDNENAFGFKVMFDYDGPLMNTFRINAILRDGWDVHARQEKLEKCMESKPYGYGADFLADNNIIRIHEIKSYAASNREPLLVYIPMHRFAALLGYSNENIRNSVNLKTVNSESDILINNVLNYNIGKDCIMMCNFLPDSLNAPRGEDFFFEKFTENDNNISFMTIAASNRFRNFLKKIQYIGPMRQTPLRFYSLSASNRSYVGSKGEHGFDMLIANNVLTCTNYWLNNLETGYQMRVANLKDEENEVSNLFSVQLVHKSNTVSTSLMDVGFGISQILPIIIQACTSEKKTLIIEQPELHIHPALQAELGDLVIDSAINKKNTLLIETHSEHLLLRIMRRMRETSNDTLPDGASPIRAEDVSVVYVESVETDGDRHSIIREMPLNDQGELVKAWPGGFFEEGLREVF